MPSLRLIQIGDTLELGTNTERVYRVEECHGLVPVATRQVRGSDWISIPNLFCTISELGLCDDKKKLMRKKVRRGLKEGDPGYLERASETDSALEDSSEGSDSSGRDGSANSSDSEADSNENDGGELELSKTLKALLADEGDVVN